MKIHQLNPEQIVERNAKIIKLWNENADMSSAEVAARCQCSKSIVCGVLYRARAHGLVIRKRRWKTSQKRKSNQALTVARTTRRAEAMQARSWQPLSAELTIKMGEAVGALRFGQCRFPVDAPDTFAFCEADHIEGSSYCQFHHDLSHRGNGPNEY